MAIILVRHEESKANRREPGWEGKAGLDVPLSDDGHHRSRALGERLMHDYPGFLSRAHLLESPAKRVGETVAGIIAGAGLIAPDGKVLISQRDSDKRLGEIDFGGEDWNEKTLLQQGGIWAHRFASGESLKINGCINCTSFMSDLEDLILEEGENDFLIVSHGWTILTFVVVWFNLQGNVFDTMENIGNGEFVTIKRLDEFADEEKPVFTTSATRSGEWGVTGIHFRNR